MLKSKYYSANAVHVPKQIYLLTTYKMFYQIIYWAVVFFLFLEN